MKHLARIILILSDSLSLPRVEPEMLYLEDTYPYKLIEKGHKVYSCSAGGSTSYDILRQLEYVSNVFDANTIFVLQFGIVDCTPRKFSKIEQLIIKKFRLRLPIFLINYIGKFRTVRFVDPVSFERNCLEIKNKIFNKKYIIIPIGMHSSGFRGIESSSILSVNLYNDILNKIFKSDVLKHSFNDNDFMSDRHHLNSEGHNKIFQKLILKLNTYE